MWNHPLKQALRLCGTPTTEGGAKGVLCSAEKIVIVLTLTSWWWQRIACQVIIVDDMCWNEWEQPLGRRPKNDHVSVDGYVIVATAAHKTLQTRKSRCSSSFGRKLTCPNQLCDRLGEPR
jgi:hypothetical protein